MRRASLITTSIGCAIIVALVLLQWPPSRLLETGQRILNGGHEESEALKIGLYSLLIVLLVRLLFSMRELRKRTSELDLVNRTLEQRVEQRTQSLSATNAALESEVLERQRAEAEARRALREAEAASRTKSEFLANMSHEIRTPMTSILGFSERLLDSALVDTERIEALSTIRRNGEHLQQIIDDILDISKIEAGKLAIERVPCAPRQVVAEVYGAMDVRAAVEGVEFKVVWRSLLPERIVTDPVRLRQILLNLIGNAIKFSPNSCVRLEIEFNPGKKGQKPALEFAVIDTGIGMDEATITRLFRPFTQADNSTTRRFGGTGLGLSICKHLVERLGGQISVESRVGAGSVFRFSIETGNIDHVAMVEGRDLSFLCELADADVTWAAPLLVGARILLAEDGEDNRRLLGYIMAASRAQIDVVMDGAEAVERARAAMQAGRPYHAILMDMQMPVLDGYAASRRLRDLGCTSPIIALTAHAMATDRQKCLDSGCDDFCTKPILHSVFFATLSKHVGRAMSRASAQTVSIDVIAPADSEMVSLVRQFIAELGTDVDQMRAALDKNDMDALAHLAHRLKGAAGSYGFPSLTANAAALERRARSNGATVELTRELENVITLCAAARAQHGVA